ncbi:MAG: MopE-related protein, partial [Myxococcota bacterium]
MRSRTAGAVLAADCRAFGVLASVSMLTVVLLSGRAEAQSDVPCASWQAKCHYFEEDDSNCEPNDPPGVCVIEVRRDFCCDVACGDATSKASCKWYADCDRDGFGAGSLVSATGTCLQSNNNLDCDDDSDAAYPGGERVCDDGLDNNCDGWYDSIDRDNDGAAVSTCGQSIPNEDCDDENSLRTPGREERCDGIDNNCDDDLDANGDSQPDTQDEDGDGRRFDACEPIPDDCDDYDGSRYVGAVERCDAVDHSCEMVCDSTKHDHCFEPENNPDPNSIDPYTSDNDGDGDLFHACHEEPSHPRYGLPGDCDDADAEIGPSQFDRCADGIDQDCSCTEKEIEENDFLICDGNDKLDTDICGNGIDDDCNGQTDESEPSILELCNDEDDNCDALGQVDENVDADRDGSTRAVCEPEEGEENLADDCVDALFIDGEPAWEEGVLPGNCHPEWTEEECNLSPHIYPGATEICNNIDDDCDGEADEPSNVDGDDLEVPTCTEGWDKPIDPDDESAVCNNVPQSEEDFYKGGNYYDADGDGIPECRRTCFDANDNRICEPDEICPMTRPDEDLGAGVVTIYSMRNYFPTQQCAENSYTVPGGTNVFFAIPDRIEVSKGSCSRQWSDLLFENPVQSISCRYSCQRDDEGGTYYAFNWCDNGLSEPGDILFARTITLDTTLGDWEDVPTEASTTLQFETSDCDANALDKDGDGHFPPNSCYPPANDCDDDPTTGSDIYFQCHCDNYPPDARPNLEETCDGFDNDCDGEIDEVGCDVYYTDRDGDGLGDESACFPRRPGDPPVGQFATVGGDCNDSASGAGCGGPCVDEDGDGFAPNCLNGVGRTDCDDRNPLVFPGAPEICDGLDNDCDCVEDNFAIEAHQQCLTGQGECTAPGTYVCRDGELYCRPDELPANDPVTEVCGDGVDNDCNGGIDEGCHAGACEEGQVVGFSSLACLPDTFETPPASVVIDGGEAPDSLPASFAVNDRGAATYAIPIVVPPGRRGLQPNLSVVYNSQLRGGRFGHLGHGFTLSGVPGVERCARRFVLDGWTDGAKFQSNDVWCIDGERLVRSNESASIYYLSSAPFEPLVESAQGFTWSRKDGSTWHFDNPMSTAGTAWRWRLTRIEDSYGNAIDFDNYDAMVPTGISYNDGAFAVVLRTEASDAPFAYRFGSLIRRSRLRSIEVYADGQLLRTYAFSIDDEDRLTSIVERAGEAEREVSFDWESSGHVYTEIPRACSTCGIPAPPGAGRIAVADIDGDGLPELGPGFQLEDRDVRLRYARLLFDDTLERVEGPWRRDVPKDAEPHPPDCESDDYGKCDDEWGKYLIRWWQDSDQDGTAEWWVGEIERNDFYVFHPDPADAGGQGIRAMSWRWRDFLRTWMGDFDGDGNFEVLTTNEHGNFRTINPAVGMNSVTVRALSGSNNLGTGSSIKPLGGDFDGDGAVELRFLNQSRMYDPIDGGESERVWSLPYSLARDSRIVSGDFNADGVSDIANCDGPGHYALGGGQPGRTFAASDDIGLGSSGEVFCTTADFDRDGDTELFVHVPGVLRVFDFIGDPGGAGSPGRWVEVDFVALSGSYEPLEFIAGDFNGDGDTDLYFHSFEGSARGGHIYFDAYTAPRVTGIREHYDRSGVPTHAIEYAPVHDPAVYEGSGDEGSCSSDLVCSPPSVDVVSETRHLTSANSGSSRNHMRYRYGAGESARDGRFGGFRWRTVEEVGLGRAHRYEKTKPAELSTYWEGGVVTQEYHVASTAEGAQVTSVRRQPATPQSPLAGKAFFTYVSSTDTEVSETTDFAATRTALLDGTLRPPSGFAFSRTEQFLDEYGNVTYRLSRSWQEASGLAGGRASVEEHRASTEQRGYFAPGASAYEKRRGLFQTVETVSRTPLCNALLVGDRAHTPARYDSCPPGSETTSRLTLSYNAQGDVRERIVGSERDDLIAERFEYSPFGNVVRQTAVDLSGSEAPVVSETRYSADGLYPESSTNAAGQVSRVAYDRRFGGAIYAQDVDGVSSSSAYDAWGREVFVSTPTRQGRVEYSEASLEGHPEVRRVVSTYIDTEANPRARSYLDARGRVVVAETRMSSGDYSSQTQRYDRDGRVVSVSTPAFEDTPAASIQTFATEYDSLGRAVSRETGQGAFNYRYVGPETFVSGIRSASFMTGSQGDVIAATHGASPGTTLVYFPSTNGELLHVSGRTAGGERELLVSEQDSFGRTVAVTVSDTGRRAYRYNAWGEVLSESDAAGRQVFSRTDLLGRPLARAGVNTPAAGYSYDVSSGRAGIGGLAESHTADGARIQVAYDALGRVSEETHLRDGPDGAGLDTALYANKVAYRFDAHGRLKRELMVEVPSLGRPALCFVYDDVDTLFAVLLEIDGPNDGISGCRTAAAGGTLLMQIVERAAEGR